VIEQGYPGYEVESWSGLMAPAKTPATEVSQIGAMFTAALKAPAIQERLNIMNSYSVGVCGADFAAYIRKQYDDTARAIRDANIKAQ
jgi:tripartite-type tricarboxylate transporter receptor subunit TctC